VTDTTLFTTAEARAFNGARLTSETDFLTATITAKEVEIREWLERVCGVNFVSTTHTAELHDGDDTNYLRLNWPKVTSVTAISVDGTAFTATELSTTDYDEGLAIDAEGGILRRRSGWFDAGWSNVSVTYVAGFVDVPDLIKRAALSIAVTELPATNVSMAAEDYDAGGMSVSYGRGDGYAGAWHRIPDVMKAIRAYSYIVPGVA
jgi:hypothetical protein